jgi:hypothetical protein
VCKTPEEVRDVTARKDAETKMLECLSYLEDGVAELNALDEGQWRWERECTRVARERLALQHDREIVALAAKLARAEIEEVRAALDVAQSEEAERDA